MNLDQITPETLIIARNANHTKPLQTTPTHTYSDLFIPTQNHAKWILTKSHKNHTKTLSLSKKTSNHFNPQQITPNHIHSDLARPKYIFTKWILIQSSK